MPAPTSINQENTSWPLLSRSCRQSHSSRSRAAGGRRFRSFLVGRPGAAPHLGGAEQRVCAGQDLVAAGLEFVVSACLPHESTNKFVLSACLPLERNSKVGIDARRRQQVRFGLVELVHAKQLDQVCL